MPHCFFEEVAMSVARQVSTVIIFATLVAPAQAATWVSIPFNPTRFSNPLNIDNPYFPLVPGTTFTYKHEFGDGCEVDTVTVTGDTRRLARVTTRVVHDVVYLGSTCATATQKIEDTTDYYAQDDSGNVWYMGEDALDCSSEGCTVSDGSWLAAVDRAEAGIIMLAHPFVGAKYKQENSRGHAQDVAEVIAVDVTVTLQRPDAYPPKVFPHSLRTFETTILEPRSGEGKAYAPSIGQILTVEDDKTRDELVDITHAAPGPHIVRPSN
jgi:hypothetical protein